MTRSKKGAGSAKLPGTYTDFVKRFPKLGRAHEQIAAAVEEAGPLDAKTRELLRQLDGADTGKKDKKKDGWF